MHNASCGVGPNRGPGSAGTSAPVIRPRPHMEGSVKGPKGKPDIKLDDAPSKQPNAAAKGYVGERIVRQDLENAGYRQVHGVGNDADGYSGRS